MGSPIPLANIYFFSNRMSVKIFWKVLQNIWTILCQNDFTYSFSFSPNTDLLAFVKGFQVYRKQLSRHGVHSFDLMQFVAYWYKYMRVVLSALSGSMLKPSAVEKLSISSVTILQLM